MPKPKPVLNPAPLTNAQIVEKMNISLDTMLAAVMESGLGMETDLEVVAKFTAIIFTSAGVPKDQFMEFMSENWNDEETNAVIQRAAAYHTNH